MRAAQDNKNINKKYGQDFPQAFYAHLQVLHYGGDAVVWLFLLGSLKPVIGLLLILVVVVMLERVLHTTYTIHAGNDGRQVLTVYRGRFACQTEIPLDSITSVSERRTEPGHEPYGADRI